jgi:outer membrane protein TolC
VYASQQSQESGVGDNPLLQYVELVMMQSDEALSLSDLEKLTELELENRNLDYEMQWYPSLALRNSPQGQLQSAGFVGVKQFEFGTRLKFAGNYEQFESNVTNNVTKSPSLQLTLEQDLFRNFGTEAGRFRLDVAEISHKIQLWRNKERLQGLIEKAIRFYFQYYLANEKHKLSLSAHKKAQVNLDITQSRFDMGLISKLDLYRAKRELLNSKNQTRIAFKTVNTAREQYTTFAKLQNKNALSLEFVRLLAKFETKSISDALNYRPDWQVQGLLEKQKKLELAEAKRNLSPDVKLVVGAKKYYDLFENEYGLVNDEIDWTIALNYNTNFDATREQNNYLRQQIMFRQFERDKAALKQQILSTLESVIDEVELYRDMLEVNSTLVEQAKLAVELATIRFKKGLSSNLELVEAETELQKNQVQYLESQIQYNFSLVTLARQSGQLDKQWLTQVLVK